MKTYDIFPFNDELEILEIRLNTLDEQVDHFVVVEAENDYYNNPKPRHFLNNEARFAKFKDKVIYVNLPRFNFGISFANDAFQKNAGFMALRPILKDDDVLIYSDCDEIPRPEYIEEFKKNNDKPMSVVTQFHHYALDVRIPETEWYGSVLFKKDALEAEYAAVKNIQELANYGSFTYGFRDRRADTNIFNVKKGYCGWHLTYMANKELGLSNIHRKTRSHTHGELHYLTLENIKDAVKNLRPLNPTTQPWRLENFTMDETNTPKYVLNNLDKYQHLLYKNLI